MNHIRGYNSSAISNTMRFGLILLFLILLSIGEGRAEIKVEASQTSFVRFELSILNWDFSEKLPGAHYPANIPASTPLSNHCYVKEGRLVMADRGPESPFIVAAGLFLFFPLERNFSIQLDLSSPLSSFPGHNLWIRPPPSD